MLIPVILIFRELYEENYLEIIGTAEEKGQNLLAALEVVVLAKEYKGKLVQRTTDVPVPNAFLMTVKFKNERKKREFLQKFGKI